ncbi:YbgA family protein [Clostridium sp. DL1XJH146]
MKPKVLVSKCLGFENCRYNGEKVNNDFVKLLGEYVEYVTVCPEVEIGLNIPREALRIIEISENKRLVTSKSREDKTSEINEFSRKYIENICNLDGCIFKGKSPTCGVRDAKLYNSWVKGASSRKGMGMFSEKVMDRFNEIPIEDDCRLKDFNIRNLFLTKLFVLNEFNTIYNTAEIKSLVCFHKKNKYLFTMYNKNKTTILDRMISDSENSPIENFQGNQIFIEYKKIINQIFNKNARIDSKVNTLIELLQIFSEKINEDEYRFINTKINEFKNNQVAFSNPLSLIEELAIRFNLKELYIQSIFNPYPRKLILMRDSGKKI